MASYTDDLKQRRLGDLGVFKDPAPYDLPQGAWSGGNNIQFRDGRVARAPIFRSVDAALHDTAARACEPFEQAGSADNVIIAFEDGDIRQWSNGTGTEITAATKVKATSALPYQIFTAGEVLYVNRGDDVPYSMDPSRTTLQAMPDWRASNFYARVLRPYGDRLIAINTTEAGVEKPSRVRWSHPAAAASEPPSWDETDATYVAGFNDLVNTATPLLDGRELRSQFIVYSGTSSWKLSPIGGRLTYRFDDLFSDDGVIATNCVEEVEGRHYVFGRNDLYMHDGVQKTSLAAGRYRRWLYKYLDNTNVDACFVYYDAPRREVMFCFPSLDPDATFSAGDFCNRALVYNLDNGTWAPRDLPNVADMCLASAETTTTYSSVSGTYATYGGVYSALGGDQTRHSLAVNAVSSANSITGGMLLGYDNAEFDSLLAMPLQAEALVTSWVERIGLDLDEYGIDVRATKLLKSSFPQIEIPSGSVSVKHGSSEYQNPLNTVWTDAVTISPANGDYRVDAETAGRYLAIRFEETAGLDWALSSIDLDIKPLGKG